MSTVTAAATKKRKKSDTKPQAQINKCNNEKRRRELENIFIEELADLIQATVADMNPLSVKPDKCAILQETVNQIRSIKQREAAQQSASVCPDSAVQQGEVSSSRPTILANDVIAPLLLEALEGFLFVVNKEGNVEFVTENIIQFLKYNREEILGKSIYNIIHHGDHDRFASSLLPVSINWQGRSETNSRSRSFNCRLLIKPPDDQEETMEEKQQRVNCYEHMHISSTQVPNSSADQDEDSSDSGPRLMCVARRIPKNETANSSTANQIPIEQFTTKLDPTTGKIIGIDTSGITQTYSKYLNKDLQGRTIRELCVASELNILTNHLKDTITSGQSTSGVYRLRVGSPDKFIKVQTKSRLFKNNPPDIDFIMATHTLIGHEPVAEPQVDLDGGNVGGPLMTSVMNGARNGVANRFQSSTSTSSDANVSTALSLNTTTSFNTYTLTNTDLDFGDLFPHSTWGDLETNTWETTRPDSCQSITPVSTPTRPPSAPVYSPAPPALPSPFTAQQSPSAAPNPPTPANPFSNSVPPFPFSPLQESSFPAEEKPDTKENVMQESGRLRNLLLKPPASASDSTTDAESSKNQILKNLLDQEDEEDKNIDRGTSPRGLMSGSSSSRPNVSLRPTSNEQPKQSNNMLLKLLNEKNDDDDLEKKVGLKGQSELLQQLLKDEDRKSQDVPQNQDDSLLQSLGFPTGDPGRARKRPSDERDDDITAKRSADSVQVTSSGPTSSSKLCEKNKMLASLLAKQPSSTPIPPIPASVISATPQDKLPRVNDIRNKNPNTNYLNQAPGAVSSQTNSIDRSRVRVGPGRPPSYLNQMLTPNQSDLNPHNVNRRNQFGMEYSASSSTDNSWNTQSSDPYLSDLLDEVIDIVPDAVMTDSTAIMNILEAIDSPTQNTSLQNAMNEKAMAINAIQKSLMQCESVVKSPSSPTIPSISLPGTPPAYSAAMTSAQTQGGFPPPPSYQRPSNFSLPRQHVRPGAPQYAVAGSTLSNQQQQILLQQQQQRKLLQQQEQQKRRLLQQQQQQQLLIPSNVQADPLGTTGLQNIDNLLNHTVAPNVTLQRSSSVPDSQLSPGYGNAMMNVNNGSQNQRQPYSPHSQLASPLQTQQPGGYPQTTVNNYAQTGSRLSPHPPFQQQLSPRQGYPASQGNAGQTAGWTQQQQTNRLSLQQQQNPMLNAQLTGNYSGGGRGFPGQQRQTPTPQQQRAIGSPGSAGATRQSPFPAEQFQPPASPTSGFNQSQFQQQMRLQRTMSTPTATTQLPGGLGSPRQYAGGRGDHGPHPGYPQPPSHVSQYPPPPHPPPNPMQQQMMYQESQYCYDQTGLQLTYNGQPDRGRGPPPHPHIPGGATNNGTGMTSEYVRQELRAVVGARTGQSTPQTPRLTAQLPGQPQVSPADLEALGLSFEMPTSGASDSPKLWGQMGSDMGSMSPQPPNLSSSSRTTTEEMVRTGEKQNSSLLQKLLSE